MLELSPKVKLFAMIAQIGPPRYWTVPDQVSIEELDGLAWFNFYELTPEHDAVKAKRKKIAKYIRKAKEIIETSSIFENHEMVAVSPDNPEQIKPIFIRMGEKDKNGNKIFKRDVIWLFEKLMENQYIKNMEPNEIVPHFQWTESPHSYKKKLDNWNAVKNDVKAGNYPSKEFLEFLQNISKDQ